MIYGSTQNGVGLSVGRTTEEALHPSLNNSRIFVLYAVLVYEVGAVTEISTF